MTPAELRRLAALTEQVTPGDWRVEQGATHLVIRAPHQTVRSVATVYDDFDAYFIAAARTAVPDLLAEIRHLRAVLANIRDNSGDPAILRTIDDALGELAR